MSGTQYYFVFNSPWASATLSITNVFSCYQKQQTIDYPTLHCTALHYYDTTRHDTTRPDITLCYAMLHCTTLFLLILTPTSTVRESFSLEY